MNSSPEIQDFLLDSFVKSSKPPPFVILDCRFLKASIYESVSSECFLV